MGNELRHAEFLHMLELERLSQVNPVIPMQFLPRNKAVTIQTSKCGFDVLEQCVPEVGL